MPEAVHGNSFLSPLRMFLFSVTTGAMVANLYYAQPILPQIAETFSYDVTKTGYLTTFTQIGYALGNLFLVPLGDVANRRKLLSVVMLINIASLLVAALSPNYLLFALASLAMGVTACGVMVIVPYVASHSTDSNRGRMVGIVMTGLLLGILLARTISGSVAQFLGWRAIFLVAAAATSILMICIRTVMPAEKPRGNMQYGKLLFSLLTLVKSSPTLRLRAFFGFLAFCSFSILWTGLTFVMHDPPFNFSVMEIGLLGLIGASACISANIGGRMVDKGYASLATYSFGLMLLIPWIIMAIWPASLTAIIAGVFLVDVAVQGVQITNQTVIYKLDPNARARIATVYVCSIFVGAALGSAIASAAYDCLGWSGLCAAAAFLPAVLLLLWVLNRTIYSARVKG